MVSTSAAIFATEMHPVNCVFDKGAGPSLIREDFLRLGWNKMIRLSHGQYLNTVTSESVSVLDIIPSHVRMGDWRVCVEFGVVHKLSVPGLLGTCFIDCLVRSIFPSKSKAVLHSSKPVPMLMLTMQTSEDGQEDISQEGSGLLVHPEVMNSEKVQMIRQVKTSPMCQ